MDQFLVREQFPLGRLKDLFPPEFGYCATEHYSGVGGEVPGQIRLVEPDRSDGSAFVSHGYLCARAIAEGLHSGLPYAAYDGLLLLDSLLCICFKFGYGTPLAVVDISSRGEVEQVTDCPHAQPCEPGSDLSCDASDDCYGRIQCLLPLARESLLVECPALFGVACWWRKFDGHGDRGRPAMTEGEGLFCCLLEFIQPGKQLRYPFLALISIPGTIVGFRQIEPIENSAKARAGYCLPDLPCLSVKVLVEAADYRFVAVSLRGLQLKDFSQRVDNHFGRSLSDCCGATAAV